MRYVFISYVCVSYACIRYVCISYVCINKCIYKLCMYKLCMYTFFMYTRSYVWCVHYACMVPTSHALLTDLTRQGTSKMNKTNRVNHAELYCEYYFEQIGLHAP